MALLRNASTHEILSRRVERAVTPWRRSIGFLFTSSIDLSQGLWFARCGAIHTLGMRSFVDVIFLDRGGTVVAALPNVRPNRFLVRIRGARTVLEMGPGFLDHAGDLRGEQLELIES